MPELPEVEVTRQTLEDLLLHQTCNEVLVREKRLRFPVQIDALKELVEGREIVAVRRRAKYLLFDLGERKPTQKHPHPRKYGASVMLLHLGMTGRLSMHAVDTPYQKHDHLAFSLEHGCSLRFNDTRRFGFVEVFSPGDEASHPRLVHLGPEPLNTPHLGAHLFERSRNSKQPIKTFLMDSKHVVGVGNIYASEVLFASKIHPKRAAGKVSRIRFDRLAEAIQRLLYVAIECGGTTLRDFRNAKGEKGCFADRLQVYARAGEGCFDCNTSIKKTTQGGRSTFYCSKCQR